MKSIALGLCTAVLALAPVSTLADGTTFTFQSVVSPGDPAFTQLLGINNAGTIAGYFGDGTVVPNNGFTLSLPSTYAPENFPGSAQTQVVGINNTGETVGFFTDSAGNNHGFLYNIAAGTYQQIDDPHASGSAGTIVNGINDNGQLVGFFNAANNNTIGMVATATTPEPASLLLLSTAVLGLSAAN